MKSPIKYISILLASILALSPLSPVYADENPAQNIYFGVGVSLTDLQLNEDNILANINLNGQYQFDNSSPAFKLFAGYRFDQYLAIEMDYTSFGNTAIDNGNQKTILFSADSLVISMALNYPVTQNIDLYGKLGVSAWIMDSSREILKTDGTGMAYGVGLDINLYGEKTRVMRVEWLEQSFDDVFLSQSSTLSASIVFRFY